MSLQQTIQELATLAAMAEADDAPRLVALRDGLHAYATYAIPDQPPAVNIARTTADLIEKLVLRDIEDIEDALLQIHEAIDYLQNLSEAAASGADTTHLTRPRLAGDDTTPTPASTRDTELVTLWLGSATHAFTELEGQILALDNTTGGDDREELLATIKRGLHTLKGECGVLAAHHAQNLCHEAENAIARTADTDAPFPTDPLLALLDWMRTWADQLSANPDAPTPDHQALLAQLTSTGNTPAPVAATPAPSTPVSTPTPAPKSTPTAPAPDATTPTPSPTVDHAANTQPIDLAAEDDEMLAEFMAEAREHLDAAEAAALELENNATDVELINTIFRAFHTIKGVAGFMNLKPIVRLSHVAEFLLDAARSGQITLNDAYLDLILQANDLLGAMFVGLQGGPVPTEGQLNSLVDLLERARNGETIELGNRRRSTAAETIPGAAPAPVADADEEEDDDTPAAAPPAPGPRRPGAGARRPDQTIKVNTGRLDSLVDLVGELVIAQQMVVQDPLVRNLGEQRTQRNLVHVGKIIRDLQEVAMSLRMVTVRGTFQKMARLVRDVSVKAGKNINFHMEGEDTELDRNVVDEIGDPLVHMVRNACDHGIEPAEVRREAGKPDAGNLTLRAFHKGGSIIIEIQDDGRGLNREKILKKAIERGIYAPDRDVKEIPDSEVFNLIFLPGFSTADKVTDISGRGVGMDVVRRNIEALRGKVEIRSTPGEGSTFMMRLPLTMAIIDGMVVRVGSQRYVVPTLAIEQSFRPTPDHLTRIIGRGEAAMVRGSLLPVYRLNRLFNIPEGSASFDDTLLIVLESNNSRACLMVDEILGQQQVVIKSLGTGIGQLRGVSGGAILGDGRVALILDVAGLFAEAIGEGR